MGNQMENRWEYDAVSVDGMPSKSIVSSITANSISNYATRVRNSNERYHRGAATDVPIPIQMFQLARLRRQDIALANDHVALEWVKENPRQTPFAKCAMRWNRVIHSGEKFTSSSWVIDKYERRGNKFVTFGVNLLDESGAQVADYDYTSIFEYAPGQKHSVQKSVAAPRHAEWADSETIEPRFVDNSRSSNSADLTDLDSLLVGEKLPEFVIGESQATIDATRLDEGENESPAKNIHNDAEFASEGIFAGTVNGGVTTMSYIVQMLEPWFPVEGLYDGGSLEFKAINPFRPGDIVKFGGTISNKSKTGGRTRITCDIEGVNTDGQLIGVGTAVYNLE
jgi:acyl dehydratase